MEPLNVRPETTQAAQIVDRRALKLLTQQMSKALRDSQGGGLMERFEAVSKLLFLKVVDERRNDGEWLGLSQRPAELVIRPGDTERLIYERARQLWVETTTTFRRLFAGDRGHFPADIAGVARIVRLMQGFSLTSTSDDIKGAVYEEMLRNTFEKNENQQYFTPRHIVDFMVAFCNPQADAVVCDPACGSGGFLVGALQHVRRDRPEITLQLRGAEIDDRMGWVARINLLMHGGDPRAIHTLRGAGSLAPLAALTHALPAASFDLILTNPPFGSDMTDRDALRQLAMGRGRGSRRRGVLFVERCLELLRPGGRLAIVLDDSVLNLASNQDVREYVLEHSVVEAVISLPDVTFMPYSTAKSSILVVRRRQPAGHEKQGPVFMADVEQVGVRPNGDPLYGDEVGADGRRLLRSDLPDVLERWREHQAGQDIGPIRGGSTMFLGDLSSEANPDARLDVFFFHPTRLHAEQTLQRSAFPLVALNELVQVDTTAVKPADEYGDATVRWIGLGDIEALTGRYDVKEVVADRIKSASHVFRGDDILFSRLRPKLRKCILLPSDDEGGVCSGELLVVRLREQAPERVMRQYLAYMLRSDLVFGQLIYQVTGVGRPRINAEALLRVRLPLPPLDHQARMIDALVAADEHARELRAEAARRLDEADAGITSAYESVVDELLGAVA